MKLEAPQISSSVAILIGSIVIALAILIAGGTISIPLGGAKSVTVENNQNVVPPQAVPTPEVQPLSNEDHLRGNKNARILLIEYSDLECPFCKSFHATVKQTMDSYDGQVAWVYRHFPLDQLHSKARKEAESSECAFELGGEEAFWKFIDKIFEVTPSNNGLDLSKLSQLAGEIGLDGKQFQSCLDSGKYASKVEEQYQSGVKAGVSGTPKSFLLDTKTGKIETIPGAVPYTNLKQSVDNLLKS